MKHLVYKQLLATLGFVLTISILFFQCRKNEDLIIDNPQTPVYISGGVIGNVINWQGNPEPNVKVTHGNTTVTTDENGVFILKNQLLNQDGAQIKFEKAGFYTVYKSVIPIKDKVVTVKTKMVLRNAFGTVIAATGGEITLNGNARISFPKQSIMDASGKDYAGQFQVYAYWMDPTRDETTLEMPGNLTGRDKAGKEVCLQTLGMIAVELEDMSGNPLNIATGKYVEIKFPIPASLDSKANASIPLWYYDVVKGGWIEEGFANKQGSYYIGQVAHFSFWNCDYPFPAINLKGKFLDVYNRAIGNVAIEIIQDQTGQRGYGYTTIDGYFEGKIPASSSFTLKVGEQQCNNPFELKFSTTTSDLDLADIHTTLNSVRLYGNIFDCSGNIVSNGYLQAWIESSKSSVFLPVDAAGSFNASIVSCINTDVNYFAVDLNNFKQSTPKIVNTQTQNEINLGISTACEDLTNVITAYFKGTKQIYVNAICNTTGSESVFFGIGEHSDSSYIQINLTDVDLNKLQKPSRMDIGGSFGNYYYYYCNPCTDMNVTITQYGPVGTQIVGSYYGKLKDQAGSTDVDVHGEFSVERTH